MTNLLNNSFKYGAGKPIRIVIDSQATTARFSVTDQGIGISEADQTRLFEPFARATELHQRQSLGGNSNLVREIGPQRTAGASTCAASQARATTFIVELPVDAPA